MRLQAFRPDRSEATICREFLTCSGNRGTFRLPFAFNDAPGDWRLRVTDVATGVSKDAQVTLE